MLPPPGAPEIRLLPFPASPLSLSGKPYLLQVGLVLPNGDTKICLGPPALRRLTVSQEGGRVHQSVEQGRVCRAVGPCCGGPGSVLSPELGSSAPLPIQGKPKGLFFLFPVLQANSTN